MGDATLNFGTGIAGSVGSTVSINSAHQNTTGGIAAYGGSTVAENTVAYNQGIGLTLASKSACRENTINRNLGGTVAGGGVNAGANVCNRATTCP